MGVLECNSYSKHYNPTLLTSSPQTTRREACTDTIFLPPAQIQPRTSSTRAPEVSVLTTEVHVYSDSIRYWNKTADISVNLRFRIVALS